MIQNYRETQYIAMSTLFCNPLFTEIDVQGTKMDAVFSVSTDGSLCVVYNTNIATGQGSSWDSTKLFSSVMTDCVNHAPLNTRPFVVIKDVHNLTHIFAILTNQHIMHMWQDNNTLPLTWDSEIFGFTCAVVVQPTAFQNNSTIGASSAIDAILGSDGNIRLYFLSQVEVFGTLMPGSVSEIYQLDNSIPRMWSAPVVLPFNSMLSASTTVGGLSGFTLGGIGSAGTITMAVHYYGVAIVGSNHVAYFQTVSGSLDIWNALPIAPNAMDGIIVSNSCPAPQFVPNIGCYFQRGNTSGTLIQPHGYFNMHDDTSSPLNFQYSSFGESLFGFVDPTTKQYSMIQFLECQEMGTAQVLHITQRSDTLAPDPPPTSSLPNPTQTHSDENWNISVLYSSNVMPNVQSVWDDVFFRLHSLTSRCSRAIQDQYIRKLLHLKLRSAKLAWFNYVSQTMRVMYKLQHLELMAHGVVLMSVL